MASASDSCSSSPIEGLYAGATAMLAAGRWVPGGSAWPAEGGGRGGYGLSAVTKVGLPAVGGSLLGIGLMLAADRAGKGIRTGPPIGVGLRPCRDVTAVM